MTFKMGEGLHIQCLYTTHACKWAASFGMGGARKQFQTISLENNVMGRFAMMKWNGLIDTKQFCTGMKLIYCHGHHLHGNRGVGKKGGFQFGFPIIFVCTSFSRIMQ